MGVASRCGCKEVHVGGIIFRDHGKRTEFMELAF